jgi:hypothetical protein
MLKLIHNDILRDDEKIGYLEGNRVWSHDGKKLGWFEDNRIYDGDAQKVGYIEGDYLYDQGGNRKGHLEEITESIEGALPDLGKCAIYILLGN